MSCCNRYWLHFAKLAHLGLPNDANEHIVHSADYTITAEKISTKMSVKLTLTSVSGELVVHTIKIKDLLSVILDYRKTALLADSKILDFGAFIVSKVFLISDQLATKKQEDTRSTESLATIVQKAIDLSRERRSLGNNYRLTTRRPLRILVACMRSYPFGGGEAWIMESSAWLQEMGHDVVLINFKESDWGLIPYYSCDLVRGIPRIGLEMVDTDDKVISLFREILSLYVPDLIHAQGEINSLLNQNYSPQWPPLISGYHFWNGIINLGPTSNKEILSHLSTISIDPCFAKIANYPRYYPYIVSPFMRDVVRGAGFLGEIELISPAEKKIETFKPVQILERSTDVIQLNCSILKGGLNFIKLAQRMNDKKFIGLCSLWDELVDLYELAKAEGIDVRLNEKTLEINSNSWIKWVWFDDVSEFIMESSILLSLSLVDETYGRVIAEAIERGRPVIASPNGNHHYLLPPQFLISPEDIDQLEIIVSKLLNSSEEWKAALLEQRNHLHKHSDCGKDSFLNFINKIAANCSLNHIAILAPWSEQGLGYHAKAYADALRLVGIEPHIYSFQSYAADNIGLTIQSNPKEWEGYDVHFSYNHREALTPWEIHQFCVHKNCKLLLALEICWEINWIRLRELSAAGIDVILIPNAETIRRSEISYHQLFPRILCTTKLVESILNESKITNTYWIGHGYGNQLSSEAIEQRLAILADYEKSKTVQLVHVAGYNHKRKMTLEMLSALVPTLKELPLFKLKIISQVPFDPNCFNHASNIPNIELVHGDYGHEEILAFYREASFSLQLSTHEGLGLGFYESIYCGTPVITINRQPHNEPIVDGVTGFLIDAQDFDLYDNDEALVKGAVFHADQFIRVIQSLNASKAIELSRTCMEKHGSDYSLQSLASRLVAGLQPFI